MEPRSLAHWLIVIGSLSAACVAVPREEADAGEGGAAPQRDAGDSRDDAGRARRSTDAGRPDARRGEGGAGDAPASDGTTPKDAAAHDAGLDAEPDAGGMPHDGGADVDAAPLPAVDAGPACTSAQIVCAGACVDPENDVDNCGGCGHACPGVTDGTATCSGAACGFACDSAFHACGVDCASNASTDSCGSACVPCVPPANATATCDGTACGYSCDSGYHACGAGCADDTSVGSCGSSCSPCPVPVNGVAACKAKSCGVTCNAGSVPCAGGTACCTAQVMSGGFRSTCLLGGLAASPSGVQCWGQGTWGQLGRGSTSDVPMPDSTLTIDQAESVAARNDHACAVKHNGSVHCWGDNVDGDLGDGTTTQRNSPVVALASGAIAIAAGFTHTCALLATGGVDCWGNNLWGQIGNGSLLTSESSPVAVTGITTAVSVAAGEQHSCAVLADGTVSCWGMNVDGQLGDPTAGSSSITPVAVTGLTGAVAVVAGLYHTCALTDLGLVWCWGEGDVGELGVGTTSNSTTAVSISSLAFGGDTVTALAAGGHHTCALTSSGFVYCWGANASGQLGDGTTTNSSIPAPVLSLAGMIAIGAGDQHACAIDASNVAHCWGNDDSGQLGNATTGPSFSTPVTVF